VNHHLQQTTYPTEVHFMHVTFTANHMCLNIYFMVVSPPMCLTNIIIHLIIHKHTCFFNDDCSIRVFHRMTALFQSFLSQLDMLLSKPLPLPLACLCLVCLDVTLKEVLYIREFLLICVFWVYLYLCNLLPGSGYRNLKQ